MNILKYCDHNNSKIISLHKIDKEFTSFPIIDFDMYDIVWLLMDSEVYSYILYYTSKKHS